MLDPDIRDRGVGKAVVRTLEAWIRSQGVKVMRIGVVERNTRAISFWERSVRGRYSSTSRSIVSVKPCSDALLAIST